jgi:TPR repeat protein
MYLFRLNTPMTVRTLTGCRLNECKGSTMRNLLMLLIITALPVVAVAAEKPFSSLLAGAENGDRSAMRATGLGYFHGEGVERDCYEARRWLKKAGTLGDAEALYALGLMDDEGSCGIGQAEAAFDNFQKAALQGHAGARYHLGELYRTGRAAELDYNQAFKWLDAAARQGETRAWCSLAKLYAKGNGVRTDRKEALRCLKKGLSSRETETVALCREVQTEIGLNE